MKNSTNLSSTNAIVNEILMKRANELLEFMLSNPPFLEVVSRFSNLFMDIERAIFLRNSDPASDNKANGYYERNLACSLGNLNLKVPRDRLGDFRPFILPPPYKRATDDMEDVLLNLVLSSYSPNKMKSFLNSLNLPYSKEEVEGKDSVTGGKNLTRLKNGLFLVLLFIEGQNNDQHCYLQRM